MKKTKKRIIAAMALSSLTLGSVGAIVHPVYTQAATQATNEKALRDKVVQLQSQIQDLTRRISQMEHSVDIMNVDVQNAKADLAAKEKVSDQLWDDITTATDNYCEFKEPHDQWRMQQVYYMVGNHATFAWLDEILDGITPLPDNTVIYLWNKGTLTVGSMTLTAIKEKDKADNREIDRLARIIQGKENLYEAYEKSDVEPAQEFLDQQYTKVGDRNDEIQNLRTKLVPLQIDYDKNKAQLDELTQTPQEKLDAVNTTIAKDNKQIAGIYKQIDQNNDIVRKNQKIRDAQNAKKWKTTINYFVVTTDGPTGWFNRGTIELTQAQAKQYGFPTEHYYPTEYFLADNGDIDGGKKELSTVATLTGVKIQLPGMDKAREVYATESVDDRGNLDSAGIGEGAVEIRKEAVIKITVGEYAVTKLTLQKGALENEVKALQDKANKLSKQIGDKVAQDKAAQYERDQKNHHTR
jgi:outer membrane murein-binding lipoprotein Lpp